MQLLKMKTECEIVVTYCYMQLHYDYYLKYVTGFVKRGLPHTSNLPTLTIDNFSLERAIALKFGQW